MSAITMNPQTKDLLAHAIQAASELHDNAALDEEGTKEALQELSLEVHGMISLIIPATPPPQYA
jgi:hypothetical protein